MGMNIARALASKAMEPDAAADIPLQFTRVAKAVRQTLALQARVEEGRLSPPRQGDAGQADRADPIWSTRDHRIDPELSVREQEGAERLYEVVDFLEEGDPPEEREDLFADLRDWVRERGDYADFLGKPFAEIVQRICADLDLAPDWGAQQLEDYLTEALPYQRRDRLIRAAGGALAAHEAAALNTS